MFGRRSATETASDEAQAPEGDAASAAQGKGRATPKRREAEAARKKRLAPPRNRKEANALHRERVREQRTKQRMALAGSGDSRYLPGRDQGPVKKYIRDYVDSHRTIGEYLLPIFLIVLAAGIVVQNLLPTVTYAGSLPWVIVLAVLVLDSLRLLRGLRQGITERFGADEYKGTAFYALMRSWQMRRLRLPKATVRHGEAI